MTRRLIEDWLPIAALGEESVRERRSMTALPPTYYLHVWWARRPLVASRAAVMGSLLPADADRAKFLHMLGIHGDPVAAKRRIDRATREGVRLGAGAYGYSRAFSYLPTKAERAWFNEETARIGTASPQVLDPTAGGGSIPFESVRLGLATFGNDLNPVATLIERATVEMPMMSGPRAKSELLRLGRLLTERVRERVSFAYPDEQESDTRPDCYLWARTIRCAHCEGVVPLSPNWRLATDGTGVQLLPQAGAGPGDTSRHVRFAIVKSATDQSTGTVSGGDATCPFEDCGRLISGDYVKTEAQAGRMGEQLFAVAYKKLQVTGRTKTGKLKEKWVRGYRSPRSEDDVSEVLLEALRDNLPIWEALDFVPTEAIGELSNYDRGHRMYGMNRWVDMFSPRQLLGHATAVAVFRELLTEVEAAGPLQDHAKAAFVYLSFALDKLRDYNSRATRWIVQREVMANTFDSHNFSMKWSYAEMAPLEEGLGFDWAVGQIAKCIGELTQLVAPATHSAGQQPGLDFDDPDAADLPPVKFTCKSGDSLDHLSDGQIDAVVLDPPYYDNVMYAELSDFFYVWLKRTAGYVYP